MLVYNETYLCLHCHELLCLTVLVFYGGVHVVLVPVVLVVVAVHGLSVLPEI